MGSFSITSFAVSGIDGVIVQVEVFISNGLPSFTIVGLPDTAVQESRERVRAAIINSGYQFPRTRIIVNLAPGELKKRGPMYDLPIALAILVCSDQLKAESLDGVLIAGELSLSGDILGTKDWIIGADVARNNQLTPLIPEDSAPKDINYYVSSSTLKDLLASLGQGGLSLAKSTGSTKPTLKRFSESPFKTIIGQEFTKRALTIAATGKHSILLIGPPGSGKSLLASTLPALLPEASKEEEHEIRRIYAIMRLAPPSSRPFRAPHHTVSAAALIGGGTRPAPGEITLAHKGVLLLDELPEFKRYALECLRGPIESKQVTISRQQDRITYPSDFLLIATMNPCPCGYAYFESAKCTCTPHAISRYQKRLSGPLLDRFSLVVEVPRIPTEKLFNKTETSSIPAVDPRESIELALQTISEHEPVVNAPALELLKKAFSTFNLSMRSYQNTLSVAKTIAVLNQSKEITTKEISEALQYRPRLFNAM